MRVVADRPGVLLEVLARLHPGASNRTLRAMLEHGRVRVDGVVERRAKAAVVAGAVVEVSAKTGRPSEAPVPLKVLFEDDRLLVVAKPHGLLTVATEKGETDTLYDRAFEHAKRQQRGGRVFVVHRLDRPTSGVIMFAKDEAAKETLQAQFAARTAERYYLALVEGKLKIPEGELETWLKESATYQVYATPDRKGGTRAALRYRVVGEGPFYSLVEVQLETGRKAQIRVQFAEAGHPLAGDPRYGAKTDPLRRLALHACRLAFDHPGTGGRIVVECPPAPAFLAAVKKAAPWEGEGGPAEPAPGGKGPTAR